MTIRLTKKFRIAGAERDVGYETTLGVPEEADFVQRGLAEYVLDGRFVAPKPVINLEEFGIDAAASEHANTLCIKQAINQARLLGGAKLVTSKAGTYRFRETIVLPERTSFVSGAAVRWQLAADANCNMLVNAAYLRTPTAITGAWSSGIVFTITWAAHGFAVDDHVWLADFAPSRFNGVFRVATVVNADTFTVLLDRIGTTITDANGLGRAADRNVEIIGGVWDYNNQAAAGQALHAIILGGIENLRVENVRGKNATKYVMNIGAVNNFVVDGLVFDDTPSDGLKLYGPATNGVISNVGGATGDDMVSYQTREPDAFAVYRWTYGDIINVKASNFFGVHDSGVGRLLVIYGSPNELMDDIEVSSISGSSTVVGASPITLTAGTGLSGVFGKIAIRNVRCDAVEAIVFAANGAYDILEIDGITGQGKKAFQTGSTLSVDNLLIRGVSVDITDSSTDSTVTLNGGTFGLVSVKDGQDAETGTQYYVSSFNSTIDTLAIEGNDSVGGASRRFANIGSGTVSHVRLIGNNTGNLSNFFVLSSGVSGNPLIEAYGNQCDGAAGMAFLNLSSSCKVAAGGNQCVNAGNGFIRTGGTPTIQIRSDGTNILAAGSWVVVPSGTPVLTLYGWDLTVDPIALTGLAATNGQYCTSSQASTEGGPCIKTPAGWVALGTGASGVNTVIA